MRIEKACKLTAHLKLDALIIDNPSDVFYLTGQWFSLARLVLKPEGGTLFVDGRYFGQAEGKVPCAVVLTKDDALKNELKGKKRVGFDSSFVTVDKAIALHKLAHAIEWIPVPKPMKGLRAIKDTEEISALKKAAQVTGDGYLEMVKRLKEGILEQELALDFEIFCRKRGASKVSFETIVAFGENSAYPHYRAARTQLKKNQIALFDCGAVVDSYRGDMTRVFFFGQPLEELDRFYGFSREAHDLAVAEIRPGTRVGDLDVIVRTFFKQKGVEPLFTHSLGHGVGIDGHEYPLVRVDSEDKDALLHPGMVLTIEPGLYLPGVGGVRYENTFVVTENGAENFYAEI